MQTFLPLPSLEESVKVLDYRRLGKQRVESDQILHFIYGRNASGRKTSAWANHPAVKMWRGYEAALLHYRNLCIEEWGLRGYKNVKLRPLECVEIKGAEGVVVKLDDFALPPWFGADDFHASHRQTLLFKEPKWYSQFNWAESPKYEYVWPVQ